MKEWTDKSYDSWSNGLSPAEKKSVKYYEEADGYRNINARARFGESDDHKKADTAIKHLDNSLSKASIPEDIVAFRGIKRMDDVFGPGVGPNNPKALAGLVGKSFHDKGFTSLSLDHDVTNRFVYPAGSAKLIVNVPKGSKVGSVSKVTDKVNDKQASQHELLTARGHGIKVTKVYKRGGTVYVEADLVPPP
jgi:hypothetical protein